MVKFKIVHVRNDCIGCGSCAVLNSKHWKMNDNDMKADLIDGKVEGDTQVKELDEDGGNLEVAETCAVNCVHIYKDGEKII